MSTDSPEEQFAAWRFLVAAFGDSDDIAKVIGHHFHDRLGMLVWHLGSPNVSSVRCGLHIIQ